MSLSSLLVEQKVASVRDVEEALSRQVLYGGDLATNLLEASDCDEAVLLNALARHHSLAPVELRDVHARSAEVARLLPAVLCVKDSVFPLELTAEDALVVAVSEPLDSHLETSVQLAARRPIRQKLALFPRIRQALALLHGYPLERRFERLFLRRGTLLPVAPRPSSRVEDALSFQHVSPSGKPVALGAAVPAVPFQPVGLALDALPPLSGPTHGAIEPVVRPEPAAPARALPDALRTALFPTKERKKRRGPLTLSVFQSELEFVQSRDGIFDLFFEFSRQFFDATALFAMQGDGVDGLECHGMDPSVDVRQVQLALVGSLQVVKESGSPLVLRETPADKPWRRALLRITEHFVLIPIALRGRVVAVLYADNVDDAVTPDQTTEVIAATQACARAFEALIMRRKLQRTSMPPAALQPEPAPVTGMAPLAAAVPSMEVAPPSSTPSRPAAALAGATAFSYTTASVARAAEPPSERQRPRPAVEVWTPGGPADSRMESMPPLVARGGQAGARSVGGPLPHDQPWRPDASTSSAAVAIEEAWVPGQASSLASSVSHKDSEMPAEAIRARASSRPPPARSAVFEPAKKPSQPPPSAYASVASVPERAKAPPPVDLPSMMMGNDIEHLELVDRICASGDAVATIELVRLGTAAMPALLARFPGPVAAIPAEGSLPEVVAMGPVLAVIAKLRKTAVPFVLPHCDDGDVNKRLWATYLLSELAYPEVVEAAARRLGDDDARIRRIAAFVCARLVQLTPKLTLEKMVAFGKDVRVPPPRRIFIFETIGTFGLAAAIPLLIPAIPDPLAQVSLAVRGALVRITRQDFRDDIRKWSGWWTSNIGRHRVEWLMDALLHDDPAMSQPSADELVFLSQKNFGFRAEASPRDRELVYARYREWWQAEGRSRFLQ
jgi:Type II secretion system (T2SS), protein E, N-terminal domain